MRANKVVYVCKEIDEAFGAWYVDWVERDWLTLSIGHKSKEFEHFDEAVRFQQALLKSCEVCTYPAQV